MRKEIHDKLVTDFSSLQFEGGNALFTSVKKIRRTNPTSTECILMKADLVEEISGNTETDRIYGFVAIIEEFIESSISQTEADKKIDRLSNIEDKILNYLQKEPNNLRAWGQSQNPLIEIFKIRVMPSRHQEAITEKGYAVGLVIPFTVYVLNVPQLL